MSVHDVVLGELLGGGQREAWEVPERITSCFLDVDGTTLGRSPVATQTLCDVWSHLEAHGVLLGFATGRLPRGMRDLERQVGSTNFNVVHNGAAVTRRGAVVHAWPLPEVASELIRWCLARELYLEVYSEEQMFASDDRDVARVGWQEVSGPPDAFLGEVDLTSLTALKATLNVFDTARLPQVLEAVRSVGLTAEVSTTPHMPGVPVVNVTAAGVDKGTALAWVLEQNGHRARETLVVGDGLNDLSMFALAGTAVAMAQAPAQVRDAAHWVAPSQERDGVTAALTRLVQVGGRTLPPRPVGSAQVIEHGG